MILFNPSFQAKIENIHHDNEGRWVICTFIHHDQKYCIMNVYAPNNDKPAFFDEIEVQLREAEANLIIMGDFNLTLNPEIDRLNTTVNNDRAKNKLIQVMEEYDLKDI